MVDEASFDLSERDVFTTRVTEFQFFMKKTKPFLQQFKIDLATYLTTKSDCITAYRGLQRICEFYEDLNLTHYTEMNPGRLILNNPDNQKLKE